MGVVEEERRVLAVLHEMLDAQEVGNVGRVLAALSGRPEAAHMATDGVKWETSWEAAHAVTAVPGTVFGWSPITSTFTFRAAWRGQRAWGASATAAAPGARCGCPVSWSANWGSG